MLFEIYFETRVIAPTFLIKERTNIESTQLIAILIVMGNGGQIGSRILSTTFRDISVIIPTAQARIAPRIRTDS